jgi:hypothetical protein
MLSGEEENTQIIVYFYLIHDTTRDQTTTICRTLVESTNNYTTQVAWIYNLFVNL